MKKVSVTPRATLLAIPSPNHMTKIEPRMTRGMALPIRTYGPNTAARVRFRPRAKPATTPSTTPMTTAITVSSRVTVTCCHKDPWGVPRVLHRQMVLVMPDGCPKKNGSATPVRAATSHPPRIRTATPICNTRSRRVRRCSRASAACSSAVKASTGLDGESFDRTLIGDHGLISQVLPHPFIQTREPGIEADLGHLARAGQVNLVGLLQSRRRGAKHENAVGQRNGLFQIMRDKDD